MDDQLGQQLMSYFPQKNITITVVSVMGDSEAFNFAHEIASYLRNKGYHSVDGVSQALYNIPVKGQHVIKNDQNGSFEIRIGNQE